MSAWGGCGGRGDGECSLCHLIGCICWQQGGRLVRKLFGPCRRRVLDACVTTLPSPAPPILPLPSVSDRSAIQRAGRGDSLHLLGESLNRRQELHKAHQRCLRSDLHRPSGAPSCPGRGAEGREDFFHLAHFGSSSASPHLSQVSLPSTLATHISVWSTPPVHSLPEATVRLKPCQMPHLTPWIACHGSATDPPLEQQPSTATAPPVSPLYQLFPAAFPIPTAVSSIFSMRPSCSIMYSSCCCMGMASPSPEGGIALG